MIIWMAYAALIGALIAAGAFAVERLVASAGRPRRFVWLAALTLAVMIPLTGVWRRPAMVPVVVESGTPEPVSIGSTSIENFWSAIPALPVPRDASTGKIAMFAWAAGSLASLAVLAGVLVRVARGRRRWGRTRVHGAEVYVSHRFGPALVGVARPKVVIPAWVLDLAPDARDAIIRHETEHALARDHLALLYGGLVAAAFPWSPAIWWMYRRLRAAVELDCDQRVLASGIDVADYGDVLLDAGRRSRSRWVFSPAAGQPESLLERRLRTMNDARTKPGAGHAVLLVAVAVGALVVACDTPVPAEVRDGSGEGTLEERIEHLMRWSGVGSTPPPLLYVNDERIRETVDLPESVRVWFDSGFGESDVIDRVVVVMGYAAAQLFEDVETESAGGAFRIFTGKRNRPASVNVVPLRLRPPEVVRTETVDSYQSLGENPLILVDDIRVDGAYALAPGLIDHVEILRNRAVATTLFGSEAADGVIQVFTKRGRHKPGERAR